MARDALALALVLALAACGRDEHARGASAAPPLASAAFYRLDAAPPSPCTANAPCEARLVLTALGDYHINPNYPQKFFADAAPDVAVDGTGTFALAGAKTGTLVIRFRAARAGTARLHGTFKLSVCTDATCEIETPAIAIPVAVS
jgi:hypothetical protein